jgi:hypothetical protein
VALTLVAAGSSIALGPAPADQEGAGVILYVDDDAPAGGDGSTWISAFRFLQDALDAARKPSADVTEIRVAGGTYRPDQGASVTPGDVNTPFEMVSGLALRGGYAGIGAPDPDARDFEKFQTVLSGDLLGNDGPAGSWVNYEDNSFRVMRANNGEAGTTLDGLTFTASNVDWPNSTPGGGLVCIAGSLLISDCTFRWNMAYWAGGIYSNQGHLVLNRCRFDRNRARGVISAGGAGLLVHGGSVAMDECLFTANSANFSAGGGLYCESLDMVARRCNFINNYADRAGGAASNGTFIECNFIGNNATSAGGFSGSATLIRCAINDNYAFFAGGGLKGTFTMIDCSIIDNFASNDGGAGLHGGGTFINCDFRRNLCGGSPSAPGGAGAWIRNDSNFVNCVFNANDAWARGGAVFIDSGKAVAFTNCAFTNNITIADTGGAITGNATIANSILWDNSPGELNGTFGVTYSCVEGGAAGVGNTSANPQFIDANGADDVPGTSDDVLRVAGPSPCIDAGNNDALPVDVHDIDEDGDRTELLPLDLQRLARIRNDEFAPDVGHPRTASALVDMGPMEYVTGDSTGDGHVDADDLFRVILTWGGCAPGTACAGDLDRTGVVDVDDLLIVIVNWTEPTP